MDIEAWATKSATRIRADGLQGAKESFRPVWYLILRQLDALDNRGTPIYSEEWDLLIVVDACRYDLLCEVADEYSYIESVGEFRSLASMTPYWMQENFIPEFADEMADTAYVCGNPFSDERLHEGDFATLDEVWRYAWDEPGTVPPRAVTDRTITAARTGDAERIIAHYMQPHCPFIPAPELSHGKELEHFWEGQPWHDVWGHLANGDVTLADVWEGYRENLKLALNDIGLLLENVDAERVVVTSDHGNAIGEWGVYGHPKKVTLDCLRKVPWVETTAHDTETHTPSTDTTGEREQTKKEQLRALGYVG